MGDQNLYINKAHVRALVKRAGKRWSKEAEETLNHAVMGIVIRAAKLAQGHKTIKRGEIVHALRVGSQ